jgi:UDP-glucose 4-epimerase
MNFIFSSTCATYGDPQYIPIDENHPQSPINPYGQSKLMLEKIIKDYAHAYGLNYVFLRYFNACGASEDGLIGEDHNPETHLIPLVLEAAKGIRPNIKVFGTDYDTPDGTCIRDYIHVMDLAEAHQNALEYLLKGGKPVACNLGTGKGISVKEVIAVAEKVTGLKVPVVFENRRAGDPPELVANPVRAKEVLGWEAKNKNLETIIGSAWRWMNSPTKGRYSK